VARLTPAASPTIAVVGFDAAGFTLSFPTEVGPSYTVESKHSLDDLSWEVLTNVVGTGLPITISDPEPTDGTKFYRIHLQ